MFYRILIAMTVLATPFESSSQGMLIDSGISMVVNGGNIRLENNWVNDGLLVHKNGTLLLAGDTQTISGRTATVFNNITVAPGSRVQIISRQSVKGAILCNGALNAANNLTLQSTALQTAFIDGSGNGEVSGYLTMQRYLPSGFGYKYISAPFVNASVNELGDDLDLAASFPNVYRYDEDRSSSGWVSYIDPSDQFLPLNGYAANFGDDTSAKTIDITGVVNNHSQSVTLYNNNRAFTAGFNLVGNPYPSPVDWDADGWTRTNIDNAVYYFNAGNTNRYQGTYSSYVNGVSSDGIAGNVIPSMQGFFVHVSDSVLPVTGVLTVNNNARLGSLSSVFYKLTQQGTRPLFRMNASYAGEVASDPFVLYFDDSATPGFDIACDALKLINTDERVPSIYALSSGRRLSINAMPGAQDNDTRIIPLGLELQHEGMVHFSMRDMENVPYGCHPYLADIDANVIQSLESIPDYQVWLKAGTLENRFYLAFGREPPSVSAVKGDVFDTYTAHGKLFIDLLPQSGGKGDMILSGMSGQVILRQEINGVGLHEVDAGWPTGIYLVSLVTKDGTFRKRY